MSAPPESRHSFADRMVSMKVTVIGAGPAGSVAAVLLARAGVEVTVVEQHVFPRDKVCGECLSALAILTLERVGLAEGLLGLGPAELRETRIHTADGAKFRMPLPGVMWGVSRKALDAFLLERAVEAGARVVQPGRCEGVGGLDRSVRVRDLQSNEVSQIRSDWIIAAEGKSVRSVSRAAPTGDFGIKAHFEGVDGPGHTIELFGVRGAYGGLAPIEDRKWNAAFSVPAERLRAFGGDVGALFDSIRLENPALNRQLQGARRISEWMAVPLPRFGVRKCWPAGVIPVGNAAAAIEPIGGEGMGLAIASAEIAAHHMLKHGAAPPADGLGELFREYERLWRVRGVSCRLAGMVVSRPWAARRCCRY